MATLYLVDRAKCGCRNGVQCRLCYREEKRRQLTARVPCVHEGDIVEPCPGGHAGRHVRECDRFGTCTYERAGKKVGGVCAGCPSYAPDPSLSRPAPLPLVSFPLVSPLPPPDIDPEPRGGRRLVISLNAGQDELYAVSGRSHARYAARLGADHIVLTGRAGWHHPTHEKWRYRKFVAAYDRTLALDADTWVRSDCPSLFEVIPETSVGMNRVDPYMRQFGHWRAELADLCRSQGMTVPDGAADMYFNSGVWVGSRQHADYWQPPPRPEAVPGKWCDEEQWGRVQCAVHGWPICDYGRRFNYQWYLDRTFERVAEVRPWIIHLAGLGERPGDAAWRLAFMRLLADADG